MTDRQQLLRHISILTDHPQLGKHLKQYQGLDYSTFTDKQLQDIIKKMEDTIMRDMPPIDTVPYDDELSTIFNSIVEAYNRNSDQYYNAS